MGLSVVDPTHAFAALLNPITQARARVVFAVCCLTDALDASCIRRGCFLFSFCFVWCAVSACDIYRGTTWRADAHGGSRARAGERDRGVLLS